MNTNTYNTRPGQSKQTTELMDLTLTPPSQPSYPSEPSTTSATCTDGVNHPRLHLSDVQEESR